MRAIPEIPCPGFIHPKHYILALGASKAFVDSYTRLAEIERVAVECSIALTSNESIQKLNEEIEKTKGLKRMVCRLGNRLLVYCIERSRKHVEEYLDSPENEFMYRETVNTLQKLMERGTPLPERIKGRMEEILKSR